MAKSFNLALLVAIIHFFNPILSANDQADIAPACWNGISSFGPTELDARTITMHASWVQKFPGGSVSCELTLPLDVTAENTSQFCWLQSTGSYECKTYTVEVGHTYCSTNTFVCSAKAGCDSCTGIVPSVIKKTGNPTFSECADTSFNDISRSSGIENQTIKTTAIQWIDFNNDGKQDLFLAGNNGTALFKNSGRGQFTNVTRELKIDNSGRDSRGASWADFNNDGLTDVFIASAANGPTLLMNRSSFFQDISADVFGILQSGATGTTVGGIWLNYDNDPFIDLFVIRDGASNLLFKNDGNNRFTEISTSAGVAFSGKSRSAISADFNDDGFQDIYVANFNQPNKLYFNQENGTFRDGARGSNVAFRGASVQVAISDINHDQKMDLLVVNSAGASILYKNTGNGKFAITTPPSLKKPKNGIAATFVDYDLDGDEDLIFVQASGQTLLFSNDGNGKFRPTTSADFTNPDHPSSIAVADFNNDGIIDIAIGDKDEESENGDALFQNRSGSGNNFLSLTLDARSSNRSAIGTKALVQTDSLVQSKQITSGNGISQDSLPVEIGLGTATKVNSVVIIWPDNSVQLLSNVKANKKLKILKETGGAAGPVISQVSPSSGKAGDAIIIHGLNFGSGQGDSIINFGSINAGAAPFWSDTRIDTTIPSGAHTSPVSVTVGGTKSNTFEVQVLPGSGKLDPTSGPSEGGTTVTIIAPSELNTTQFTVFFGESPALEVRLVSQNTIVCKTPPGTGTVDVKVGDQVFTTTIGTFTYQ